MPTLDFKGKQHIYAHHLTVPHRPLIPHKDRSIANPAHISAANTTPAPQSSDENDFVDGDDCINNINTTPPPISAVNITSPDANLIIHGDNLHALKALIPRYAGRINCIYIDPPYNTGNEGWAYNDRVNSPLMRQWFDANTPVDGEDLERHDKWLCMMWPRLHLLRELLADNGVIFISIDDNEQHHLRMLMDEIFGAENFLANIAVVANLAGSSDQFGFAGAHEHCLVYAKDRGEVHLGLFTIGEDALADWEQDEVGYYKPEYLRRGSLTYSESLHYPIFVDDVCNYAVTDNDEMPDTGGPWTPVYPIMSSGNKGIWRWSKERIRRSPDDVFVQRRSNGNIAVYSKQRPLLGGIPTEKPKSVFYKPEYGSRAGGQTLTRILSDQTTRFAYPKSVSLITDIIKIGAPDKDAIILDSFAGSGTTAHAVLALNKEDGGNRKFILIECEDYADSITAERVRRVINGVPNARDQALQNGLGGSFAYYTLGDPIAIEQMLTGDQLPAYSALAAYLLYTATGASTDADLAQQDDDGLFYADDSAAYHLLYEPDIARLCAPDFMLTETRAQRIAAAARAQGKRAIVFGPGKYISQRALTQMGVTFCQIPYEMHRNGGG